VTAALHASSPPPPARTLVLTAARDLPAGVVLQRADLTSTAFAPDSVPSGALAARSVVGRTTTSAIRSGEPITGPRLAGSRVWWRCRSGSATRVPYAC
jgi:Flp pilus assembly protein CpaB